MLRLAETLIASAALVVAASPSIAVTIPDGFVQWRVADGGNGHWYGIVDNYVPTPLPEFPNAQSYRLIFWEDARDAATLLGGHLATITSADENDFVVAMLEDHTFTSLSNVDPLPRPEREVSAWIGGFQPPGRWNPDENWQWVTGEPFEYSAWGPEEPNDYGWPNLIRLPEDYLMLLDWAKRDPRPIVWNDTRNPDTITRAYNGQFPGSFVVEIPIPEPITALLALVGATLHAGSRHRR